VACRYRGIPTYYRRCPGILSSAVVCSRSCSLPNNSHCRTAMICDIVFDDVYRSLMSELRLVLCLYTIPCWAQKSQTNQTNIYRSVRCPLRQCAATTGINSLVAPVTYRPSSTGSSCFSAVWGEWGVRETLEVTWFGRLPAAVAGPWCIRRKRCRMSTRRGNELHYGCRVPGYSGARWLSGWLQIKYRFAP